MGNELLLGEIIATSSRNEFKRWLEMLSGRGVGGKRQKKEHLFYIHRSEESLEAF